MTQDALFMAEPPLPISALTGKPVARARATDPQTSHEAARSVNVSGHRALLLRAARFGAGSAEDLRELILDHGHEISESSARSRCAELCRLGLLKIVDHNLRKHAVYALTSEGERAAYQAKTNAQERGAS